MPLKKDAYEMAGLRVRHTDNCFRATVMLEKKEKRKGKTVLRGKDG